MTDSEKLDILISAMANVQHDISSLKDDVKRLDEKLEIANEQITDVDLDLRSSERRIRTEIKRTEDLILSEVERVHGILDKHAKDLAKHTA